jgi:hypothetical protein
LCLQKRIELIILNIDDKTLLWVRLMPKIIIKRSLRNYQVEYNGT